MLFETRRSFWRLLAAWADLRAAVWERRAAQCRTREARADLMAFIAEQQQLGREFERVWDENAEKLYEHD